MTKWPNIMIATALISTLMFTHYANASECYEQSPNLASLGDKYYGFDKIKVFSAKEEDKLSRFLKNLSGKWKGKSVIIDCFGPDNAAEKKVKNATIKATIQPVSNRSLSIQLNQKIREDRSNTSETLTLLDPTNTFEFSFQDDNHLVFSEKYRRGNVANQGSKLKSSRLIEAIYALGLNNGRVTLQRSYYTNGVYTGEEKWSMQAK